MPRLRPCAALLLTLALMPAAPAAARDWPTISEFSSGYSTYANAIAAGPDDTLWVSQPTDPGRISRIDADGAVTPFTAGSPGFTADQGPSGMLAGPDGAMWFLQTGVDAVARITAAGRVTEFTPLPATGVKDLALGSDGAVWVAETGGGGRIARVTPDGTLTKEYPVDGAPASITAGPDGALWFTVPGTPGTPGKIGRLSTTGRTDYYSDGLTEAPADITTGADGNLWFTEPRLGIGRITPAGQIKEFDKAITPNRSPRTIAAGPDGALWFTEGGLTPAIGRITVDGVVDEYKRGLGRLVDPLFIAPGTDGGMVFTSQGTPAIGHITVPPAAGATTVTATAHDRATFSATVRPNAQVTTYRFEFRGPTGPPRHTSDVGAGNGLDPVTVAATVDGLAPETTYTVRVVAANDSGTTGGPQTTFTTPAQPSEQPAASAPAAEPSEQPAASAPAAQPQPSDDAGAVQTGEAKAVGRSDPAVPTLGESVVAKAAHGEVTVKVPGKDDFVALDTLSTLPVGSVIDATDGEVRLRSAVDTSGRSQTATFRGGRFKVAQGRSGKGMTELLLRGGSFAACAVKPRRAAVAAASRVLATVSRKKKRTVRRLWGKDSGGHFRTHGRDSIATVRGTEWLTEDRCDGTRTKVRSGAVEVRDRATGKKVLVRAGHSHVAPHKR